MRRELTLRNVVCLAENVAPSAFDVGGFAESLDLGSGEDTLRLENILVTEWDKARLQILPDRLQLGFKQAAESALVRRAANYFLGRCDELAPGEAVGFNAAIEFAAEAGDPDPSENVVKASSLVEALGGKDGRGGFSVLYRDDISRWWIEFRPQPVDEGVWTFDFNRHFKPFPPGVEREGVLDWFADVEANMLAQFETICGGAALTDER